MTRARLTRVALRLVTGLAVIAMSGCGTGSAEQEQATGTATTRETAPAATTAQQSTGAPALRKIADGFDQPVHVIGAPDSDRLFVVEKPGRIRMLVGKARRTVLNIPARVFDEGTEQGLLSLAFHPRFPEDRRVFVCYTDKRGTVRIVEMRMSGDGTIDPRSEREIFTLPQKYPTHNGGLLLIGPDKRLWVGFGDGGSAGDPDNHGQNPRTRYATIARFDIPPAGRPYGKPRTVAIGVRNPWRFSFDRRTGDLWIGDVGQNEIEEVDYVPAAQVRAATGAFPLNFGWSVREGKRRFKNLPRGPGRLVGPIHQYTHDEGCSVTGGYVYRGRRNPGLQGWYLFADFCADWLGAIKLGKDGDAKVVRVPGTAQASSFGTDRTGELYLVTLDGKLYRVNEKGQRP